ncbi:hypothetical protein [Persicobacter psychrovividus]|uniref:Outer membrane protein beta-barrel domain-containing protein n=1 Tax=Persicobacter psychrovividus TaxID=387638 RepID=A0ABN6L3V3_9BACT|nr:hypothetical protein PEPS_00220 [Persicobacter psychrovividus]
MKKFLFASLFLLGMAVVPAKAQIVQGFFVYGFDQFSNQGADKSFNTFGAEVNVFIPTTKWGINAGYSTGSVKHENAMFEDGKAHNWNVGVAYKLIKLPLVSVAPIVGLNGYSQPNIENASENFTRDTEFGLDLGLTAHVAFIAAIAKYDPVKNYGEVGIGFSF